MKHMTLGSKQVSRWTTALIGALVLVAVGAVALADQGVLNSATGSGHIALWAGQPYWDSYSFTARILADGRVQGQVQYFDKELRYRVHGEVFDLKVEGNMAKIGYRIKHGGYPYPGFEDFHYGFFVVVDNGEGGGAASADMISWLVPANEEGFIGTPLQDFIAMNPTDFILWEVAMGFEPQLFTYINGNIQVR